MDTKLTTKSQEAIASALQAASPRATLSWSPSTS